jgi:transposase
MMVRDYFWLNDEQFARLEPLLPTDTRGKPRVDDRRVISGIIHILKSGCRWADEPEVYGPRKTLYNRFVRWAAKGAMGRYLPRFGLGGRTSGTGSDRLIGCEGASLCLGR